MSYLIRDKQIPSEYVEVEYIQTSGTQRIRIKLDAKVNEFLEIGGSIQLLQATSGCFFSETSSTSTSSQQFVSTWYSQSSSGTSSIMASIFGAKNTSGGWNIYHEQFTNFVLNTKSIKTDITSEKILPRPITKAFTYLDIFNRYGQSTYGISCRLKKLYLKQGTKITFDFIPVKKKSNNEYGLYDLVSKQFYGNLGTGSFTGGEEVTPKLNTYNIQNRLIPSGYSEVEYIYSSDNGLGATGNNKGQWINLNYVATNNTRVLMDIDLYDAYNQDIIGTDGGSGSTSTYIYGIYNGASIPYDNYNDDKALSISKIKGRITIDKNKNFTAIKGAVNTTYTHTNTTFTAPTSNFYLFARYRITVSYPSAYRPAKMKLYYCKIWENDVLQRDMIPVKRKSDNIYGLYDLVENKFYKSDGATEFTGGMSLEAISNSYIIENTNSYLLNNFYISALDRKIPNEYDELEYLQSTEQQSNTTTTNASYIDTGYIPNKDTIAECDMSFDTLVTNSTEALFGFTSPRFAWGFANVSPTTKLYFGLTDKNITHSVNRDAKRHKFKINSLENKAYVDDVATNIGATLSSFATGTVYLFARHSGSSTSANKPANATVYSFKVWEGSETDENLKMYLVPCKRKSDNELGMYDIVNNNFLTNIGTKNFVSGPVIQPKIKSFLIKGGN